jgi:uncharacterized protein (TIGR00255 family)
MLRSMTGFGGAVGQVEGAAYAIEIRSVNNRYFKANIKLPDVWATAEGDIEKILRGQVQRGTVMLSVRMKLPQEQAAYHVNTEALKVYMRQLRLAVGDDDGDIRIDLAAMLQLPGVCEPPPLEQLCQRSRDGLMALIREAVEGLVQMRCQEGQVVQEDLRKNCQAIRENLEPVSQRSGEVVKSYHERLTSRVQELTAAGKVKIDEDSLAREVAIFAERCDIAEEVSRLGGHLDQFARTMDSSDADAVGRKLDFIAQEMLREANTIASKANDVDIARWVVNVKTAIDRIKEQVQNVE